MDTGLNGSGKCVSYKIRFIKHKLLNALFVFIKSPWTQTARRLTADILQASVLSCCSVSSIILPMTFLQQRSAVEKRGQQHLALTQMVKKPARAGLTMTSCVGGKTTHPSSEQQRCVSLLSDMCNQWEKWQHFRNRKPPSFTDCKGSFRWDLWVWSGQSLTIDGCVCVF